MGNEVLGKLGYTEHSQKHAAIVARRAAEILKELGYSKREIELAKITGYMHDIGNCVNRHDHAHSGAIMAFQILRDLKMPAEEIAVIVSAIGNHDESTGTAVTPISAAVIIADKTDDLTVVALCRVAAVSRVCSPVRPCGIILAFVWKFC